MSRAIEDTKPTIDERLASAANTSSRKVEAERGGDGDVLIAAGWTLCRCLGGMEGDLLCEQVQALDVRTSLPLSRGPRPRRLIAPVLVGRPELVWPPTRPEGGARQTRRPSKSPHTQLAHRFAFQLNAM